MPESPTTAEPKRKRRWYQYSLRTFLLLMTAICIWLGWLTNQARQQRAAVACVEEMGGTVSYDYQSNASGFPDEDAEPPGPKWLREMLGVDFMADVVSVQLVDTPVSDVTPLAGLKNLQRLKLTGTRVSEEPVTRLRQALPNCVISWEPEAK